MKISRDAVDPNGLADAVRDSNALAIGWHRDGLTQKIIFDGGAPWRVNSVSLWDYVAPAPEKARAFLRQLWEMDGVSDTLAEMEVMVHVAGSGPETLQQAHAIAHAVARALMECETGLAIGLTKAGFKSARVADGTWEMMNDE